MYRIMDSNNGHSREKYSWHANDAGGPLCHFLTRVYISARAIHTSKKRCRFSDLFFKWSDIGVHMHTLYIHVWWRSKIPKHFLVWKSICLVRSLGKESAPWWTLLREACVLIHNIIVTTMQCIIQTLGNINVHSERCVKPTQFCWHISYSCFVLYY